MRLDHITNILSHALRQLHSFTGAVKISRSSLRCTLYFPLCAFLRHFAVALNHPWIRIFVFWTFFLCPSSGKMSHPSTLDLDRYSSLEKSRRSTSRNQHRGQAKNGEVLCDFCTTRRQKAEKSCLVCLASYCEAHLQSHYEYPAMMKHKLVKATGQMREKICAQHDKLLEAFCRTDQTSVCVLCMMDEHKHHDIVPAGTERTEKQVGV